MCSIDRVKSKRKQIKRKLSFIKLKVGILSLTIAILSFHFMVRLTLKEYGKRLKW